MTEPATCPCSIGPQTFIGQNICSCQATWLLRLGVVPVPPYLLPVANLIVRDVPDPPRPAAPAGEGMRADEV